MYKPPLQKLPLTSSRLKYAFIHRTDFFTPGTEDVDDSHIHNFYEIYVFVSGDVSFLVNNRLYSVKKGDMIITRPGDVHVCILNSPCIHDHFCVWFDCQNPSAFIEFAEAPDFSHFYSLDDENRQTLLDLLYKLEESASKNSEIALTASVFSLMAHISSQRQNVLEIDGAEIKIPTEMQRVLDYINENFAKTRYISDVVDNTYVSATTLSRWFRKYIHLTPHEYLETKKLSHARKLLEEGKSVTDVCMESGFSDCSHFISVFKKKFGSTPSKYARDTKMANK